jgi:hypothetical protein
VRAAEAACAYGCLDPECDACVPDGARQFLELSPLRAITSLATAAGHASRWARELVRVAERLRP